MKGVPPNVSRFSGGRHTEPSGRAVPRSTSGRGRDLSNGAPTPVRWKRRVRWLSTGIAAYDDLAADQTSVAAERHRVIRQF